MLSFRDLKVPLLDLCLLLCFPWFLTAAGSQPNKLEVRLLTHLTSYLSPPGTPFQCVVLRGFEAGGHLLIPKGSVVSGHVVKQQSVGLGFRHERAALELAFDTYRTWNGHAFALDAALVSIDNSREEVTPAGRIKGVLAANNPGNLLNGFWARPSSNIAFRSLVGLTGAANQVWLKYSMGPMGAAGLFIARSLIVAFPEPEIHLPPGTDMELTVKLPHPRPGDGVTDDDRLRLEGAEAYLLPAAYRDDRLSDWTRAKIDAISYRSGKIAPDLFNVVIFGSRLQVVSAFQTSGWALADQRSLSSSSRVWRAFSSKRNYASAPVSPLYYRGALPELVFEKSFNTITQRHHVRFWKAGVFNGEEVWLGAATHDTGVQFKLASFSFTHKIDRDIDVEREKVSTDLDFAGCSGVPFLLNSSLEPASYDAGKVSTDGRVVVLSARACMAENPSDDGPGLPGNRFSRGVRRVVLETRNYLLRDNAYYWAYRIARTSHNRAIPLLH